VIFSRCDAVANKGGCPINRGITFKYRDNAFRLSPKPNGVDFADPLGPGSTADILLLFSLHKTSFEAPIQDNAGSDEILPKDSQR